MSCPLEVEEKLGDNESKLRRPQATVEVFLIFLTANSFSCLGIWSGHNCGALCNDYSKKTLRWKHDLKTENCMLPKKAFQVLPAMSDGKTGLHYLRSGQGSSRAMIT